ncbi:MurR/RpiR family transcriptional regulator [Phyllobacterium calauticae]|jgi:RpiR family transcriptional regulator, carbohydrate utilization regulator|uniref:MurR/RpiR family transcriptional regulator n=1 Tax=Phyllobacterium calauticae TaxID=2817027 RepID=UPI001CBD241D|nr:MurR/RpiR family transcriptional regulator [Phyllobacterium calauticae]MBZ3691929.1 MurR/RpiR family transcriptional regulator [Phyllobacterium calauticae]
MTSDREKTSGGQAFSGVIDRIQAIRKDLAPAAGRIADFITKNAADVVHMSVTEVAERAEVSEGSVIGFCQTIGARGFQQIKLSLARELVQPVQFIHEDLTPDDDTAAVIEKVFQSDLQALRDTQNALDVHSLARAVEVIRTARRVEVFGIGSAATIAEDTNYRLLRIGIESRASVDSHVQAITASLADSSTAVITISHSGSTIETLTATRLAKEAGATTIAITNFGKSPLLAHADIVLNTLARETQFRTEAMTSRIAQLAIVDALIACLALADYDRSVATLAKTFEVLSTKRV